MTPSVWALAAGFMAAFFATGVVVGHGWSRSEESARRTNMVLATGFIVVALAAGIDLIHVQIITGRQIDCTDRMMTALHARSEARAVVDKSTEIAQDAMAQLLDETLHTGTPLATNPNLVTARDAFARAAKDRRNDGLQTALPACR